MLHASFGKAPCAILLLALGGCSGFGKSEEVAAVDPNMFPSTYRADLVRYLAVHLTDPAEFRGAVVSSPVLKPIGSDQRYVVCLRLGGTNRAEKATIFYAGQINQYIDATAELCNGAAYQPFSELALAKPQNSAAR